MKIVNQRKNINGKIYNLVSIPLNKNKSSANKRAERYRNRGFKARVIKIEAGRYAVYTRRN